VALAGRVRTRPPRESFAPLSILACLVLLLAQRGLEVGTVYPTLSGEALHPRLPIFDHIPPGQPWRFVAVGYSFVPNAPALYALEAVRGYEPRTFPPLFTTYPPWCDPQPVWFNRVDDPGRPFLSFLNVRWALLANGSRAVLPGWTLLHHDGAGLLYENP